MSAVAVFSSCFAAVFALIATPALLLLLLLICSAFVLERTRGTGACCFEWNIAVKPKDSTGEQSRAFTRGHSIESLSLGNGVCDGDDGPAATTRVPARLAAKKAVDFSNDSTHGNCGATSTAVPLVPSPLLVLLLPCAVAVALASAAAACAAAAKLLDDDDDNGDDDDERLLEAPGKSAPPTTGLGSPTRKATYAASALARLRVDRTRESSCWAKRATRGKSRSDALEWLAKGNSRAMRDGTTAPTKECSRSATTVSTAPCSRGAGAG